MLKVEVIPIIESYSVSEEVTNRGPSASPRPESTQAKTCVPKWTRTT